MYSPLLPQSRSIAVSVSLSSLGTIIRRSTSKLVLYSGSKFQSQEAQSLLISSPFDPCDEGPISVSSTPEPDSISIPRYVLTLIMQL